MFELIDMPISGRLPPEALHVWLICQEDLREMDKLFAEARVRVGNQPAVIRHLDRHYEEAVALVIERMVDVLVHNKVEFLCVSGKRSCE